MGEQIIVNGLTLSKYMRKHVQELAALRSLVREMGEGLQTVVVARERVCLMGPRAFFLAWQKAQEILNRESLRLKLFSNIYKESNRHPKISLVRMQDFMS